MEKISFHIRAILLLIITALTISSCSNDDDNSSTVKIMYYGYLNEVQVTDAKDSTFIPLIEEASGKLKLSGFNSAWEETATSDIGSVLAATGMANYKACKTFKTKIESLTMKDIKQKIFSEHSDSLINIGYPSAESIPLHNMELVYYLRSATSTINIDTIIQPLNP